MSLFATDIKIYIIGTDYSVIVFWMSYNSKIILVSVL